MDYEDGRRRTPVHQSGALWLQARLGDRVFRFQELTGGLAGELAVVAASTIAFQATSLLVQLLLARMLGPRDYGDWSLLLVAATYLSYLQLGVSNAMNREIPFCIGAGELERVERIRAIALSGTVLGAILGVVALLLLPRAWFGAGTTVGVLAATALFVVASQLWTYVVTYLQSMRRFGSFSWVQGGLAVATLCIALPAARRWGVSGAMLGLAIAYAGASWIGWVVGGIRSRPRFNLREWVALVRVGLPIMLVGIGYAVLTTIDRWVIREYLGSAAVGLYSFQTRLVSVSVLLCGLVASLMYPRMAELWGRTRDVRHLRHLIYVQVGLSLGLTAAAAIMMLLVLPWAIPRFWPEYAPSLVFLPVMILGMTFLPLCAVFGVVLNVVDRQVPYLLVQVLVIGVGAALSITVTRATRSLTGTAAAAAATYGLYLLLLIAMSVVVLQRLPQRGVDPGET